jgi:hypothetical protein
MEISDVPLRFSFVVVVYVTVGRLFSYNAVSTEQNFANTSRRNLMEIQGMFKNMATITCLLVKMDGL